MGATWDTDLDWTRLMCPADGSLIPLPGAGTAEESLREDIAMTVAHTMYTLCRNENRQLRFSEVGRVGSWLGARQNAPEMGLSA